MSSLELLKLFRSIALFRGFSALIRALTRSFALFRAFSCSFVIFRALSCSFVLFLALPLQRRTNVILLNELFQSTDLAEKDGQALFIVASRGSQIASGARLHCLHGESASLSALLAPASIPPSA